jgi:prepilin-type processing-associated H-X9-DG protein
VGRHHPGSSQDRNLGGTANFVYVDGHVENAHVLDTILKRQWGSLFYSITGANEVRYIIK